MSKKAEPASTSNEPLASQSSSSSSPLPAATVSNVSHQLENLTVASPDFELSSVARPVSHASATVDPVDSGAVYDPRHIVSSSVTCNFQATLTKPRSLRMLLSLLNRCVLSYFGLFSTFSHVSIRLPQLLQLPWTTLRKSLMNLGASDYENHDDLLQQKVQDIEREPDCFLWFVLVNAQLFDRIAALRRITQQRVTSVFILHSASAGAFPEKREQHPTMECCRAFSTECAAACQPAHQALRKAVDGSCWAQ
jgi:hypothetical protein